MGVLTNFAAKKAFSAVISNAAGRGDLNSAKRWLQQAVAEGIEPGPYVSVALLRAAAANGDFNGAEHWFNQMTEAALEPDDATLQTLVEAATRARDDTAAQRWRDRAAKASSDSTREQSASRDNAQQPHGAEKS